MPRIRYQGEKNTPIKISIIVPVYNAGSTIKRCIDSILHQTFSDFEVLLIDDGSNDNSGLLCNSYAKKDNRIHAYHKQNGGVSSARQWGIEHSQGDYTIHVDPDDWIEPLMLERLYQIALIENSDMVICDFYENGKNKQKYLSQKPTSLNAKELLIDVLTHLHGSCCNKLIRRECYQKYNVQFPLGINYCEDQYVIIALLQHPIKVSYLPEAFYHYENTDKNSLSRTYNERTYEYDLNVYRIFEDLLKDSDGYNIGMRMKRMDIISRAFNFGYNYYSSSKFKHYFYDYRYSILHCNTYPLYERFFLFCSCIGLYKPTYKVFMFLVSLKSLLRFS
ncbi:glycosyltransferase family 2 protein [Hoylesella enoeca]|uniref:Glycosyltransferase 2-like domain-containing protein n=1 Tax=Hoylesella enoeca TaxID=76123 RepID=A0A0S2KI06_9BACT|nr:glycosyltransferase family 2 protein [Hoylesella enoeca]ALO47937.1 hypothetical protein AS203_01520 [Hoylesella enoeca]